MQTINKKNPGISWLVTIMLAVILFASCNSGEEKKEEPKVEAAPAPAPVEQKPTDTLAPVDSTGKQRPDPSRTELDPAH
jgi:hypothetical protein